MNIEKIPISVFKSATSTEPANTTLGVFLRSQKHLTRVQSVRMAESKEVRNELKKRLPAATISGTFAVRNMAGIQKYNGLICLDFDGADNPDITPIEMKTALSEYQEVAYAGLSVSGTGVFAIIPTNMERPEGHAHIVDLLGELFALSGLKYDRACKDVCRLRFVSHDDAPWWNPTPTVFDAIRFLPRLEARETRPPKPVFVGTPKITGDQTRDRVERLVSEVESAAVDVTTNYEDWMRLGMALASEFGTDGEQYFLRISQMHAKYNPEEARKKFQNFVSTGKQIKIGTFFKILDNQGIRL